MRLFLILSTLIFIGSTVSPLYAIEPKRPLMTPEEMVKILEEVAEESKAAPGMVMMKFKNVELTCIYDEKHDRMRIIVPIAARGNISSDQLEKAMNANFHTALDARYALNKGILFAAFIHPLSPLTRTQLESAFFQTATLAVTFGKEYTSGALTFHGGGKPM